ncbi:hypothetical protein BU25DRAFT_349395 [Macroventuria anomochaeta]|uniref:Uncharacterized protein n=1 Tax=Macroventuria anomochaeta TaxID=301207 RepID=A0ACB6RRK7_9PLEO|nr:uncharacterized protein BU25DRAFT_349395 [Macroventuria anomochaeta]KAF2623768.1 hypothetical protein BU25DRAFT_349395 [Macroventuria anomochaeta]
MDLIEIANVLGSPARFCVRVLLLPIYLLTDSAAWFAPPARTKYARNRYGPSFRWRFWLSFDIRGLEALEKLINTGSDEDILRMRDSRLDSSRLIALVGALLASVAIQALSLPRLADTHAMARALFIVALSLSVLATFFTCIQQREFGAARNARALRAWLSNGTKYGNHENSEVYQSSIAALHLLEAPYEILTLSVAIFIGGIASYLGSAWVRNIGLGNDENNGRKWDDVMVIVAFVIPTVFAIVLFNTLLGSKDEESRKTGDVLPGLEDLINIERRLECGPIAAMSRKQKARTW